MKNMRKTWLLLFGSILTGTACAGPDDAGIAAGAIRELRAAEQAFADAFAARDYDRFASFIHDDAVFSGRDGPLQGKEAVLAVWKHYFESEQAPFRWAPDRVLVSADGNSGATTGPVWDGSGRHVAAFSSTWMRQLDGSWQVVFDLSPSCPPPPGT